MIRSINKDINFLKLKSIEATIEDKDIIKDLKDTLLFYKDTCVGMASNMISFNKRIIGVNLDNKLLILVNPCIIKTFGFPYEAEEGCLSLKGLRKAKRYEKIKVEYLDENFKKRIATFEGFFAQIIQHEMDHLEGIII